MEEEKMPDVPFGDRFGHPGCYGCQICFGNAFEDELADPAYSIDKAPTGNTDEGIPF